MVVGVLAVIATAAVLVELILPVVIVVVAAVVVVDTHTQINIQTCLCLFWSVKRES